MLELLSLVQRWLESARLPWANMLYDGGSNSVHNPPVTGTGEVARRVDTPSARRTTRDPAMRSGAA